jgi:hypothetical protein
MSEIAINKIETLISNRKIYLARVLEQKKVLTAFEEKLAGKNDSNIYTSLGNTSCRISVELIDKLIAVVKEEIAINNDAISKIDVKLGAIAAIMGV